MNVAGVDDTQHATGNQQVVYSPFTKRTYVAYSVGKLGSCDVGLATYIIDDEGSDGQRWGAPRNISSFLGSYYGLLPGPGNAVVTTVVRPGRIVFAGHLGAYVEDNVFYSDDGGVTFSVAAAGTADVLRYMDEPAIAELPNGTLVLNLRNNHLNATCKCRAVSYSHDGGETWSPLNFDPVLISPVCEASIVRINDRLYFSNPASTTSRSNLTIRRTEEDSTQWSPSSLLLVPGSAGDGYSAIAPGELLVAPLEATPSLQLADHRATRRSPQSVLRAPTMVAPSGLGGILYEGMNATRPKGDGYGDLVITFNTFPLDF